MAAKKIKKPTKQLSLVNRIFFILNLIVIGTLTLCLFTPQVSPAKFKLFAFLAPVFPLAYSLNLLFVLYWGLQWRRYFAFSAIMALVAASQFTNFFQININKGYEHVKESGKQEEAIKVMSFNVRVFDLYNWTGQKKGRNEIFKMFQEEQPDIICIQEYYNDTKGDFKTHDTLVQILKAKNAHLFYTKILRTTDKWGIATYSKYPIINREAITFGKNNNNVCIYTDMVTPKDTLRVFNCHLQSAHLNNRDYKFIEEAEIVEKSDKVEGLNRIYTRLGNAYVKRAEQVDTICKLIKVSPYKVLLCGDFNDTPNSYTYNQFTKTLNDAFKSSGSGIGKTYTRSFAPFRIDYILHDKSYEALGYKTIQYDLSDHYPIYTYLIKK